jgi:hypothetical protein
MLAAQQRRTARGVDPLEALAHSERQMDAVIEEIDHTDLM